jgi:hypothetical protein
MRLAAALRGDTRVVCALVRIADARQGFVNCLHQRRMPSRQLVSQREHQHHQNLLVRWIDIEDVATDAFGRPGLIEQTVSLCFLDCPGNCFL